MKGLIMKYCIVCGDCPEDLEEGVNSKLTEGWELHGSVAIAFDTIVIYTQAMIYRKELKWNRN
jgi:hypothetical protein